MIVNVLWINIVPGFLDSGVVKLKELAQIMKDDQGVDAGVLLQVVTGSPYLAGFVSFHENTATQVKSIEALRTSDKFMKWNQDAAEDFNWATIEWQSFRTLRPGSDGLPNFIFTTSIDITPGNLQAGQEHMNKMAEHVSSSYGIDIGIYHFEGGSLYRHLWVASYDSMEQYEDVRATLQTDPKWGKLATEMGDLFDRSSMTNAFGKYV